MSSRDVSSDEIYCAPIAVQRSARGLGWRLLEYTYVLNPCNKSAIAPSNPTGPAPKTTALWQYCDALPGSTGHAHGNRDWTCHNCSMPFSAMVSGSTNSATSRILAGTTFIYFASSTTYSVINPCRP